MTLERRGLRGYVDPTGAAVTSVTQVDDQGEPIGMSSTKPGYVDAVISEPDGAEVSRATLSAIHDLNATMQRVEALLAAMISA